MELIEQVREFLEQPNAEKRIALALLDSFIENPAKVAANITSLVPSDRLDRISKVLYAEYTCRKCFTEDTHKDSLVILAEAEQFFAKYFPGFKIEC